MILIPKDLNIGQTLGYVEDVLKTKRSGTQCGVFKDHPVSCPALIQNDLGFLCKIHIIYIRPIRGFLTFQI